MVRDTVEIVDWETENVLPPISSIDSSCRNAGWAFAVRDAVTANHAIINSQMPEIISAQKLLDCTNFSCEQPMVSSDTNRFIEKVNLALESEYLGPKTGKKSEC